MFRRLELEDALFNHRFPSFSKHYLDLILSQPDAIEPVLKAKIVWAARPLQIRDLTSCGVAVDLDKWNAMAPDDQPDAYQAKIICEYIDSAVAYNRYLAGLEIQLLVDEYNAHKKHLLVKKRQAGKEADLVAFFNSPESTEGLEDWVGLPRLSIDEAVAISMGKNPEIVNLRSLQPMRPVAGSPFRQEYANRIRNTKRETKEDDPHKNLDIAIYKNTRLWHGITSTLHIHQTDADLTADKEPFMKTSEQHSLYRIMLGMAIQKYGLDVDNIESAVVSSIANDITSSNLSGDKKTVKKYLRIAVAYAQGDEQFASKRGKMPNRGNS